MRGADNEDRAGSLKILGRHLPPLAICLSRGHLRTLIEAARRTAASRESETKSEKKERGYSPKLT